MATLRQRAQSKRAVERDAAADYDDDESANDSDDATYGATKAGPKRRRSSVLQSLRQQGGLRPMPTATPTAAALDELDDDFVPLTDFKGAAADGVVGRRIRVWYAYEAAADDAPVAPVEPEMAEARPSTLKAAAGLVTYLDEERRMHVVFDGDDEWDGWWVDGRDEWADCF